MIVLGAIFCLIAGLLLAIGGSMEVTRGDVYNSGLLAVRSGLLTVETGFLISGSVFVAVGHLAQKMEKARNGDLQPIRPGSNEQLSSRIQPTKEHDGDFAIEVQRLELKQEDLHIAASPIKAGSKRHQAQTSFLIAAFAASRGYHTVSYLEGGGVVVGKSGRDRQFWTLQDAERSLGSEPRVIVTS